MTFKDAVRTCFQKYITFSGRASRSEYWWFVLFTLLASFVLSFIDFSLGFQGNVQPLSALFSLAVFLPSIAVAVRRLHDRDMTGWWILIVLVPLLGALVLMVLFVMRGTEGRNRFGPDPLGGGYDDPDDGEYSPSSIPRSGDR